MNVFSVLMWLFQTGRAVHGFDGVHAFHLDGAAHALNKVWPGAGINPGRYRRKAPWKQRAQPAHRPKQAAVKAERGIMRLKNARTGMLAAVCVSVKRLPISVNKGFMPIHPFLILLQFAPPLAEAGFIAVVARLIEPSCPPVPAAGTIARSTIPVV